MRHENTTAMFLDIIERAKKDVKRMPNDLAQQHDKYLYGDSMIQEYDT